MKKVCLLVLCLLMCSVGGMAEENLVEGAFEYYVLNDTKGGNGEVAVIVDYHLPEGTAELFIPPEVGGYPVLIVKTQNLPESVKTICAPDRNGGVYFPPEGRELTEFLYADYDTMQAEYGEWMRDTGTVMNPGDYALTWVWSKKTLNGEWVCENVTLAPELIPDEIGGQKVIPDMLMEGSASGETPQYSVYNGMEYVIDSENGTAEIVGYHLDEGQTELFVPAQIDGYPTSIRYEEVPAQIEKLWLNKETGRIFYHYGDKPKNHQRLTYDYTLTADASITLDKITLDSWDAAGVYSSKRQFADAAPSVPEKIGGYTVIFEAQNMGVVKGNALIFPPDVDEVSTIYLEDVPASVKYVVIKEKKGSAYPVTNNAPSDRVMTVVSYKEGAEPDELVWVGAYTFDFATEEWPDVKVRAEDLPEEIDGKKLSFPDSAPEFVFTCGDWRYVRDDVWGNGKTARIYEYAGEDQPETVFIPAELDGYRVMGVEDAAIPESVKVYYSAEQMPVISENERLNVTYTDCADFARRQGKQYVPKEAGKGDLIWSDVWQVKWDGERVETTHATVDAGLLPGEINGQRVFAPYREDFTYTSGEWTYYLMPVGQKNEAVAWICASSLAEGIEEMHVPTELDGHAVYGMDASAIPQSVTTLHVPEECRVSVEERPEVEIVQEKR